LAYNVIAILTTGVSPFYTNYGFNPKTLWEARDIKHLIKVATVKADKLKDLYQELLKDIK
jgi:hypothetical protein